MGGRRERRKWKNLESSLKIGSLEGKGSIEEGVEEVELS